MNRRYADFSGLKSVCEVTCFMCLFIFYKSELPPNIKKTPHCYNLEESCLSDQ